MTFKSKFNTALNIILPPRCALSGEIVEETGTLTADAWNNISFIDKPYCKCCGLPFELTIYEDLLCAACIEKPPSFDKLRSALIYSDGARPLIISFKHGDKLQLTHNFSKWLIRAGSGILSKTDIISPVPLHKRRLWKRRYNQSAVLAKSIADNSCYNFKYIPDLLARVRRTPPQKGLTKKERIKNITGAIRKKHEGKKDIENKNICIVDDVFTSGATINECAKILKQYGAKEVYALTLARVIL